MRPGAAPLLAALLVGCSSSKGVVLAETASDLKPEVQPGTAASLRLGGATRGLPPAEFNVDLAYEKRGSEITILLKTQGETLEREVYEASPAAFRILAATDDSFAPGIDIVRFPAVQGSTWNWSGKVVYAGVSRSARATVKLSKANSGILSDVKLAIAADAGRPDLVRTLSFEFEKDKGLIRRSFGDVSTRKPVDAAWQP